MRDRQPDRQKERDTHREGERHRERETEALTDAFSQALRKTDYSYSFTPLAEMLKILWCLHLHVCTVLLQFSFDPSLWWILFLSTATIKGVRLVFSHIASGFPHHVIMHPNTFQCFLKV